MAQGAHFWRLELNARRFAFSFGFVIQLPSSFFKAGIDDVFDGAPRIVDADPVVRATTETELDDDVVKAHVVVPNT